VGALRDHGLRDTGRVGRVLVLLAREALTPAPDRNIRGARIELDALALCAISAESSPRSGAGTSELMERVGEELGRRGSRATLGKKMPRFTIPDRVGINLGTAGLAGSVVTALDTLRAWGTKGCWTHVRIMDSFDAMTMRRAFAEQWRCEAAVEFIHSQAGRQFDPGVVAALVDVIAESLR
jgi:hypothetical protein